MRRCAVGSVTLSHCVTGVGGKDDTDASAATLVDGIDCMGMHGDANEKARLYRAVSQDELDDIISFGGFRPGPGHMETKLFTTSADDAAYVAREILYPLDHKPLTIVEVEVPHAFWIRLFRFIADGKPVVAVEPNQLEALNAKGRRRVMDSSPIPYGSSCAFGDTRKG